MITSNCYDTDLNCFRIDYKIGNKLLARIYGSYDTSIYECYIRNDLKKNQLNELLGRLYGDGYKDYKLVDAI